MKIISTKTSLKRQVHSSTVVVVFLLFLCYCFDMVGWVKVRHPAYKNTCAADRTGSVSEEMEKEVQQGTD